MIIDDIIDKIYKFFVRPKRDLSEEYIDTYIMPQLRRDIPKLINVTNKTIPIPPPPPVPRTGSIFQWPLAKPAQCKMCGRPAFFYSGSHGKGTGWTDGFCGDCWKIVEEDPDILYSL